MELKRYFNEEWSVVDSKKPNGRFACMLKEVSYTFLSHTVEGLMGVVPNAPEHRVATVARLPREIEWVAIRDLTMGTHRLEIRHDGLAQTTLRNRSKDALKWEARFCGQHNKISAGGTVMTARHKKVNGVLLSYLVVDVKPNRAVIVKVER